MRLDRPFNNAHGVDLYEGDPSEVDIYQNDVRTGETVSIVGLYGPLRCPTKRCRGDDHNGVVTLYSNSGALMLNTISYLEFVS